MRIGVSWWFVLVVACGSKSTNDGSNSGGSSGASTGGASGSSTGGVSGASTGGASGTSTGGVAGGDACGSPECEKRFGCCATGVGLIALKDVMTGSTLCDTQCALMAAGPCKGVCSGDGVLTYDCVLCAELEPAAAMAIDLECDGTSACQQVEECLASCWPLDP